MTKSVTDHEPKKVIQALIDLSWIEASRMSFYSSNYSKRAIGTRWIYKNNKDERIIVVRNKARLVDVKSAFLYGKIEEKVTQKDVGIFINQDKYMNEILKKFGFSTVKTSSTPMDTLKPLLKDENAEDVDVHLYRSMIGSLMYLTSSRPDIMFV
nr:hypothetical protein [Tanacetum cinerariifolium]